MIHLLLGPPGSGKSYEAVVYHILPALQQGRRVVTNLPLNLEKLGALDPSFPPLVELRKISAPVRGTWEPTNEAGAFQIGKTQSQDVTRRLFGGVWDFYSEWRHPETGLGPLYVVDECHLAMPRSATDKHLEEWFSLHRHYRADVLLVTQSYGKVSRSICDLVQMVYKVRKAVAFGSTSSYIRKVCDGLRGEVVNTSVRKYQKKFFGLYNSHTQGSSGKESGANDVRPIWMHWSFIGAAVFIGGATIWIASGGVANPLKPAALQGQQASYATAAQHRYNPSKPAPTAPQEQAATDPPSSQAAAPGGAIEPFARHGLHLTGVASMGSLTIHTFVVSQNGQQVASITDKDLVKAGYSYHAVAPCVGIATFRDISRSVICDAPQVGIGVGAGNGGAAAPAAGTRDQAPTVQPPTT